VRSAGWSVRRTRDGRTALITCHVTPTVKAQVLTEAWESQLSVDEYVGTLLSSRGKFARTIGKPGGYLIGELMKQKRAKR
jgi:hypothetical protein